jgi:crossover junction endodeoxyribonuclease RusA
LLLEPEFPLEFIVLGTPVSLQRQNTRAREEWKALVKQASSAVLPEMHFATDRPLSVTMYYFPENEMTGDIDNIIKLVLDGLSKHVYIDDRQIVRVVAQKFERDRVFTFSSPSEVLVNCMLGEKPALYVRISDDPNEDI